MLRSIVPTHMVGIRGRATFLELLGIGADGFDCDRYRDLHFARVPFNPNHSERWPRKLKRERETILDTLSKARSSFRRAEAKGDGGLREAALSRVALNEARLANNTAEAQRCWNLARLEAERIDRAFTLWRWLLKERLSPINADAACYFAVECYKRSDSKGEHRRFIARAARQSHKRQPHDSPLRLDKISTKSTPPPPAGFCFLDQLTEWEPPANSVDRGTIKRRAEIEREATAFLAAHPQNVSATAGDEQAKRENRTQATMRNWAIVFGVPHDRPFGPYVKPSPHRPTGSSRTSSVNRSPRDERANSVGEGAGAADAARWRRKKLIAARTGTGGQVLRTISSTQKRPPRTKLDTNAETKSAREKRAAYDEYADSIAHVCPELRHQQDQHVLAWRLWRALKVVSGYSPRNERFEIEETTDFGGGLHYSGFSRGRGLRRNMKPT